MRKLSALAVAAAALAGPPSAAAHLRMGTVAVSHRARITSEPAGPYTLGVYQSDLALHLTVETGHTVVVQGAFGEPLLRVTGGRSAVWHDARTRRRRWAIPLVVDGRREVVRGMTERLPRPVLWPWIVVLAAIAIAALRLSPAALGVAAGAAATGVALAFMLSAYANPGTWIAGVDEIFFVAAGLGVLRFGPPPARLPGALWLSLVGLAVGLSKGQVFVHALVLSATPGAATRLLATIAIGAGAAGAISGCLAYVRSER